MKKVSYRGVDAKRLHSIDSFQIKAVSVCKPAEVFASVSYGDSLHWVTLDYQGNVVKLSWRFTFALKDNLNWISILQKTFYVFAQVSVQIWNCGTQAKLRHKSEAKVSKTVLLWD